MTAMFHVSRRPLTRSQLQIVERAVLGDTMQEIADRYGITRSTIETGLLNARHRLGARNTTHLCAIAIALGLVDVEPIRATAQLRAETRP